MPSFSIISYHIYHIIISKNEDFFIEFFEKKKFDKYGHFNIISFEKSIQSFWITLYNTW
jgi:hypothetical protein